MPTILVTTNLPEEGFEALKKDFKLIIPTSTLSKEDIIQKAQEIDDLEVILPSFYSKIDGELMDKIPSLKMIANYGVGYNNIDIIAAKERGISVSNSPDPVIEPTAEQAFNLMHAVARRTCELDRKLRNRTEIKFGTMKNLGRSLYGNTLGIIGMGRIGKALARRAIASKMKVVYFNRNRITQEEEAECNVNYMPLEELLKTADFISLNCPYSESTHHLLNKERLALLKPNAIVVNTARGAVIDEKALIEVLQEGKIFGAGLDVFENEPIISPELFELDNVVLTPHLGTATWDGRIDMCQFVAKNILNFYANKPYSKVV